MLHMQRKKKKEILEFKLNCNIISLGQKEKNNGKSTNKENIKTKFIYVKLLSKHFQSPEKWMHSNFSLSDETKSSGNVHLPRE